ncbi:MAG: hypothetical protein ACLPQ0_07300, partial [Candidatus Binatus sp.]
ARDEIDANAPDAVRDPLAELARLIGQGDPVNEFSRNPRRRPAPQYDSPAPAVAAADWPADQGESDFPALFVAQVVRLPILACGVLPELWPLNVAPLPNLLEPPGRPP